jgi:ribonuclease P protein component
MTKSMRLRRRREFLAVQGTGTKVNTRHFVALVARARECDAGVTRGRVGLTVSKRVGVAVVRNRVKRLVREWLRTHDWIPGGYDVVIIAKDSAGRVASLREVGTDLSRIRGQVAAC